MKNLTCIILFFCSSFIFAQSPVGKGACNIGGSISYTSQSVETSNTSESMFIFNPAFSYFIVDRFSMGISLDYRNQSAGNYSVGIWSMGPALRYYFGEEKVFGFLGAAYKYTSYESNGSNAFEFSGGLDYFVAKNVSIEGSLNYRLENVSIDEGYPYYDNDISVKTFNFAVGLNVFIF